MTPSERAALLALAEAADTGAWYEAADLGAALSFGKAEDPAFIAAASPAAVKALLAALSAAEDRAEASDAANDAHGWLYLNEDTGVEWSLQHPVTSGECPDAQNVRPATAQAAVSEMTSAWKAAMDAEDQRDAARAEAARLREAVRDLLPSNIGPMHGMPDAATIPVDMTAGEIRRARAALAPKGEPA